MKIRPIGDRVVVEPLEEEQKTPSGIYIPDTAKEKEMKGRIVAIGNKVDKELDLKEEDIILYAKYAGTEIEIDDKKYLILKQSDILAKIE